MAKAIARGKALVAKLRADPKVRDPEALAVYAGRVKRLKKAGKSAAQAKVLALAGGSEKSAPKNTGGSLADRLRKETTPAAPKKKSVIAKKPDPDDDDPFGEDFGDDEPRSKEDEKRERYEAKLIREQAKAERSRLYEAIQGAGGLKTRADLREEYAGIPNTYKRRDGMAGDEMAEYLGTYYAEFGIESERDLIDFLAA